MQDGEGSGAKFHYQRFARRLRVTIEQVTPKRLQSSRMCSSCDWVSRHAPSNTIPVAEVDILRYLPNPRLGLGSFGFRIWITPIIARATIKILVRLRRSSRAIYPTTQTSEPHQTTRCWLQREGTLCSSAATVESCPPNTPRLSLQCSGRSLRFRVRCCYSFGFAFVALLDLSNF